MKVLKESPCLKFFLTVEPPLTVPNGLILSQKNDVIKKIGFISISCAGASFRAPGPGES